MHILMYRWKAYNYRDIEQTFLLLGHTVDNIEQHLGNYDIDPEFEKIIEANEKNQNLKRFDKQYQCLDKKTFHEFLEFIHEFEQKEENSNILNFITIGKIFLMGKSDLSY